MRSLFILLFVLVCFSATAQQPEHGAVRRSAGSDWQAWDKDTAQWIDIERFWMLYAERQGGLTWERGADYPDFAKVKEGDTFLVEVPQGACLMEFFHERWRRANDVRRWDDAFNDYAGCPHVFD